MSGISETVKYYDAAPYETQFDAVILAVRSGETVGTVQVVLDRTLFFPEEGGQTPDRGTLAGLQVEDVQISPEGIITHTLRFPDAAREGEESSPRKGERLSLREGDVVHGALDWEHRFSNMQNHTGEHILSGLLHSQYGFENVGFRLSDHTVTLDTGGHLTPAQLKDLEIQANEVVWRNAPVTCGYPDPKTLSQLDYRSKKQISGAVRIVTIEGVDVCACCAPHVRRTGEIGLIKILSAIRFRGGSTRITMVCGRRALSVMQERQTQLEEASRLMNEPQESVAAGVRRLQGEILHLKEEERAKEQRVVELRLEQAAALAPGAEDIGGKDCYVFERGLSVLSQRMYMNRLCEMGWRYAGVFIEEDGAESGDTWKYLIGSRGADARIPNQVLRETLDARGGGKPEMVQGTVSGSAQEIRKKLEEM